MRIVSPSPILWVTLICEVLLPVMLSSLNRCFNFDFVRRYRPQNQPNSKTLSKKAIKLPASGPGSPIFRDQPVAPERLSCPRNLCFGDKQAAPEKLCPAPEALSCGDQPTAQNLVAFDSPRDHAPQVPPVQEAAQSQISPPVLTATCLYSESDVLTVGPAGSSASCRASHALERFWISFSMCQ